MGTRVCTQGLSLRLRQTTLLHARTAQLLTVRPPLHALHATRVGTPRWAMAVQSMHTSAPRLATEPEKDSKAPTDVQKPRTIKERIQNMWSTIKYLFRFYLNGVKQIWRNREKVKKIKAEVASTGRDLTFEESTLMYVFVLTQSHALI